MTKLIAFFVALTAGCSLYDAPQAELEPDANPHGQCFYAGELDWLESLALLACQPGRALCVGGDVYRCRGAVESLTGPSADFCP